MFQPIASAVTLVIAFAVAVIAFFQFKVAHDRLRLDLFDRRYKIYDATRRFLSVILTNATFQDSDLFGFYAGTSDVQFLFDTDISEYLKQIRERAIDMRLKSKLYNSAQGDERIKMMEKEHEHLLWLTNQLTDMAKVFAPYLSYAKIKGNLLEDFIK